MNYWKAIQIALGAILVAFLLWGFQHVNKADRWDIEVMSVRGIPFIYKIDQKTGRVFVAIMSTPFREVEMPKGFDPDAYLSSHPDKAVPTWDQSNPVEDDPYAGLGEVIE